MTTLREPPIRPEYVLPLRPVVAIPAAASISLDRFGWLRKPAILLALAVVWEVLARWFDNDLLLPGALQTGRAFVDGMLSGELIGYVSVSLAILSTLGPEGLGRAIALGDWASVRKANGVGPKLAQRIVLELKDKAPSVMALGGALTIDAGDVAAGGHAEEPGIEPGPSAASARGRADAPAPATGAHQGQAMADALSALTNLGYGPSEAASAVAEAQAREPAAAMPALIRAALRLLAPKD